MFSPTAPDPNPRVGSHQIINTSCEKSLLTSLYKKNSITFSFLNENNTFSTIPQQIIKVRNSTKNIILLATFRKSITTQK